MFTGTMHLPSRSAPKAEPPAPPVKAPAAAAGGERVADLAECRRRFSLLFDADHPLPLAAGGCRYNLDGTEAGEITELHRTIAARPRGPRALVQSGRGITDTDAQATPATTAEQVPAAADCSA
jgi:hypothetical protein